MKSWKTTELDIHGYDGKIAAEMANIKKDLCKHNQKLILEFHERHSILNGVSKARQLKILNTLKLICRRTKDKHLDELEAKDAENILLQLRKENLSNSTITDYKVMIKQYFRWLDDEEGKRWKAIKKVCKPQNGEKKTAVYKPDDFMDAEERKRFLQAAQTPLEKILAGMSLCLGSRVAELGNSRINSIEFLDSEPDCFMFHVGIKNKTGYRQIKGFEPYTTIAREYLAQHPLRGEPYAPLLLNNRGKQLTYGGIWKIIRRLGIKAGIEKRLNPYSFRHMAYTDCQLKSMPQALIDLRFGHVHGSRMAKKYTHAKFSSLHEFEDAEHGKRERRYKKQDLEMNYCSQCGITFDPSKSFCPKCKRHVEQKVKQAQQEMKGNFISEENKELLKQIITEFAKEKGLLKA